MNPYFLLGAAIVAELVGTTALNLSDGFTKLVPSIGVLVGYAISFYLVSLVLRDLPIGVVYGTWSAIGIVGIATISVVFFDEPVDLTGIVAIGIIVLGVFLLNVVSEMSAH
ncbi:DMT family transporter [Halobium palmae]|uniref:DMT family transporter n=1 Tax=Halobium palmae TaxID=1776492 RepID=A0ABD5RVZ3_9EURY